MPAKFTSLLCHCLQCGRDFYTRPSHVNRGNGQYCCRECYEKSRNPNWPQRKLHSAGYKYIVHPETGARIYEHRYIMEAHLGRVLNRYEMVHHINGNVADNRIDNLMVVNHSEHADIHRPQWAKNYTACVCCGTTNSAHRARGLCRTCYARHRRSGTISQFHD